VDYRPINFKTVAIKPKAIQVQQNLRNNCRKVSSAIGLFMGFFLAFSIPLFADSTTPRLGLTLPATSPGDIWGQKLNSNFSIIDSTINTSVTTGTVTGNPILLAGTSLYVNPNGSQYWGNGVGNSGSNNQICFGAGACLGDTKNGDIGIGNSALGQQMNVGNNTAVGFGALQLNACTNYGDNTAIGSGAMASCTSGAFANPGNVAIGYNTYTSMAPGGVGGSNTLIGNQIASVGATTMFEDAVVGYQAALNYTSEHHMTVVGAFADSISTGAGNTDVCIGHSSCSGGEQAANNNIGGTTGSVFLGYSAGIDATLGAQHKGVDKSFAIGYQSYVGCNHCGVLGPNAGQYGDFHVGIDTNVPTYNLEVRGSSGTFSAVGYSSSMTHAAITAMTPASGFGQIVACSDCASVGACISTGTLATQWALITNKGSACQ
jgi:hypothetical protein